MSVPPRCALAEGYGEVRRAILACPACASALRFALSRRRGVVRPRYGGCERDGASRFSRTGSFRRELRISVVPNCRGYMSIYLLFLAGPYHRTRREFRALVVTRRW